MLKSRNTSHPVRHQSLFSYKTTHFLTAYCKISRKHMFHRFPPRMFDIFFLQCHKFNYNINMTNVFMRYEYYKFIYQQCYCVSRHNASLSFLFSLHFNEFLSIFLLNAQIEFFGNNASMNAVFLYYFRSMTRSRRHLVRY